MAALLPLKYSLHLLSRMLGVPQSRSGYFWEEEQIFLLQDINPQFFHFPTRILVTVPTGLI